MKQVKKLIGTIALVWALFPLAGSAQELDSTTILDGVRLATVERELNGQLRKEDGLKAACDALEKLAAKR